MVAVQEMGQCISVVDGSEPPRCHVCGTEGSSAWGKMNGTQRASWVRSGEEVICRKCMITQRLEQIQYEKERKAYKRAKAEMYPKPSEGGVPQLKRLKSGEQWNNSGSFYQAWKPPSTLKRLLSAIRLAQAEDPTGKQFVGMQRKPTGFVPATAPAALPADPHGVGVKGVDATEVGDLAAEDVARQREQEHLAASHLELAALEEEQWVQAVEEESLCGDGSARLPSGPATLQEVIEEEEEEEGGKAKDAAAQDSGGSGAAAGEGGQEQPRKQLLQSSSASRRHMAV